MTATDTHLLLRAFVDELARCGLRDACTSPGSRSAPLVISLVRDPRLRCHSHVDERCSAFFALGVAKAVGRPVALACTSGTAAAHFAPAVHEARQARVPLIVLTADRPPELRDVGAGQTIDQLKLYGDAAKWFAEVDEHEATVERVRWMRALACRAYWTALEDRPGVVHLNFPLREPLVPDATLPADTGGRPDGEPWVRRTPAARTPPSGDLDRLARAVEERPRGVVVCGRAERPPGLADAVAGFARAAGYPVLADPLSGARRPPAAVACYDALLRDERFAVEHRPDLIVGVGDLPTSKPLRAFLAAAGGAVRVALDPEGAWQDPDAGVAISLAGDPVATLAELAAMVGRDGDDEWVEGWQEADRRAGAALAEALAGELSEPRVAAELGALLPPEATLFAASSMPVRDVESFFPSREDPPRVLANRGANGIDGTVSSAFGAAAASTGPVVLLAGDLALLHDVGGLLAATRLGLALTIVVLNNDGGGIFHFLPIAGEADLFEEHIATPHGLDFSRIADLYGCGHDAIAAPEQLAAALERSLSSRRTTILEVRTDRVSNVAAHRRAWDAVAEALGAAAA